MGAPCFGPAISGFVGFWGAFESMMEMPRLVKSRTSPWVVYKGRWTGMTFTLLISMGI